MKNNSRWMHGVSLLFIIAVLGLAFPQLRSGEPKADPQDQERGQTSYMKVDITEHCRKAFVSSCPQGQLGRCLQL
jgi:hypothetical protein